MPVSHLCLFHTSVWNIFMPQEISPDTTVSTLLLTGELGPVWAKVLVDTDYSPRRACLAVRCLQCLCAPSCPRYGELLSELVREPW